MNTKSISLIELTIEDLSAIIKEAISDELKNFNSKTSSKEYTSIKDGLLTREETKNLLKTSYTSLWKYNNEGILKAKKLGNKVYYLKQDVINQLNKVV